MEQVINGQLDATFIYPTGGDKVLEVAMNILQKKKYNRETILSTALVNRANARIMQMQTAHISQLDSKIEVLDKIELHFPYKNVSLCKENQRHRLLMAIFFALRNKTYKRLPDI